jgi:hypothetical protein
MDKEEMQRQEGDGYLLMGDVRQTVVARGHHWAAQNSVAKG